MKTLLVVDDDESIRLLLRDEFCDLGYNVLTAVDGEEGLISFGENNIDAVILDMDISKVVGLDVLKQIRSENTTVPVVVYTANPEMTTRIEEDGHTGVVIKSSDIENLKEAVDKYCEV